jgi:hypothetical protein
MTLHDDEQPTGRPDLRRRRFALGAAGLAVVLGGGAYLITSQVVDHRDATVATDTGALAPPAGPASPSESATPPAVSASPSTGATKAKATSTSAPTTAPAPQSSTAVDQEIKEARAKAAKDGVPLMRARTAGPDVESGPVSQRTEQRKNGELRIVTAKFDLTGQGELLWPANGGKSVGDNTECTQTFRFSNEAKASTKKNLLLCWRTSATRSVVTALVDRSGKPSTADSIAVIDREWAKLG